MNITHAVTETITGDRLQAIFNRQKGLMEKYHHIEVRSGLCQTEECPINLDDKRGQARIKDFAWRITEEVGEALDAQGHKDHYSEELIDGLHFLTEMTILIGKNYNTITDFEPTIPEGDYLELLMQDGKDMATTFNDSLDTLVTIFVRELGMMCNCLKNKPWKQTHMRTDKEAFYKRLEEVWITYMAMLSVSGLSSVDVADIYLKKSQVNQFRVRTHY